MITLLCPTRNRPVWLNRMMTSALRTAAREIEFVLYADADAPVDEAALPEAKVTILCGPRITLSDMWNACYEQAASDIVMQAADDIVFRSDGWDVAVEAAFERYPDGIALVYGDDLHHGRGLGTHSFLHRRWVEAVGYLMPPYFSCDYGDTWVNEVAEMIGRRVFLPDVITEHMHPDAGKADYDQTHRERLERGGRDNVALVYQQTWAERLAAARRLRAVMAAGER